MNERDGMSEIELSKCSHSQLMDEINRRYDTYVIYTSKGEIRKSMKKGNVLEIIGWLNVELERERYKLINFAEKQTIKTDPENQDDGKD